MKIDTKNPPRPFKVEHNTLNDCGSIYLEPGEQVSFVTPSGAECDFTRTDWGFYATPSINSRLAQFGIRAAVIQNKTEKIFVVLVEQRFTSEFELYLQEQGSQVLIWLDEHTDGELGNR